MLGSIQSENQDGIDLLAIVGSLANILNKESQRAKSQSRVNAEIALDNAKETGRNSPLRKSNLKTTGSQAAEPPKIIHDQTEKLSLMKR